MRALVTGHEGYIGGNFAKKWEEKGHTWVGYDMASNHEFDLSKRIKELYINHKNKPIDVVVHFAAIPRVAFSVEQPVYVMNNNINSKENRLHIFIKRRKLKKMSKKLENLTCIILQELNTFKKSLEK